MLTRYGDIVLSTSNDQFLYGDAIFSRTAQIALVDMIYMGVIISDYDNYTKKLDHYSRLIKHRGYQKRSCECVFLHLPPLFINAFLTKF